VKWQGVEESQPMGKSYTPLQVATRLGVGRTKVMTWIASGQLRSLNVASTAGNGKRARWRVDEQDLLTFEASRASCGGTGSAAVTIPAAGAKASRIRRQVTEFIE
jgi:Helix-turn-helix domain